MDTKQIIRLYALGAFRNSVFSFTCSNPNNIVFQIYPDQKQLVKNSLYILSNFKIDESVVGTGDCEMCRFYKLKFNRCFSEKCGGLAIIIDVPGYGEFNDLLISNKVPKELEFLTYVHDTLKTSVYALERRVESQIQAVLKNNKP